MRYIEDLQNGLEKCITEKDALLFGEDIGYPYGGAFKVTKNIAQKYADNMIVTPMSEQGFTGMGIGFALQGGYAIVEIMFGDFITLCADQLINHAAKLQDVYGNQLHFVLRTPSGGYRGYGATHSQSLERLFLGIPGLQVVAPSVFHSPGALLYDALESGVPTVFIENKLDYARSLYQSQENDLLSVSSQEGVVSMGIRGEVPELTLVTYGGLAPMAASLCETMMMQEEISIQVLVVSQLSQPSTAWSSLLQTDCVLTLEEGWADFGIGAGWLSGAGLAAGRTRSLGAKLHSVYSGRQLENHVLPQENDVIRAIKELVGR